MGPQASPASPPQGRRVLFQALIISIAFYLVSQTLVFVPLMFPSGWSSTGPSWPAPVRPREALSREHGQKQRALGFPEAPDFSVQLFEVMIFKA